MERVRVSQFSLFLFFALICSTSTILEVSAQNADFIEQDWKFTHSIKEIVGPPAT